MAKLADQNSKQIPSQPVGKPIISIKIQIHDSFKITSRVRPACNSKPNCVSKLKDPFFEIRHSLEFGI